MQDITGGNAVDEHEILCMWRVVMADDCCVIQNYFPNAEGGPSYGAPSFLFRKGDHHGRERVDNYYDVFVHRFDLIKRSARPRGTMPPPVSDAPPPN